jgi:hypothetical protein
MYGKVDKVKKTKLKLNPPLIISVIQLQLAESFYSVFADNFLNNIG